MIVCHECRCFISPPCNACVSCSHLDLDAVTRASCAYTCEECPYSMDEHPESVMEGMEPETHPQGADTEILDVQKSPAEEVLLEMTTIIRDSLMVSERGARDAALKLMHLIKIPDPKPNPPAVPHFYIHSGGRITSSAFANDPIISDNIF